LCIAFPQGDDSEPKPSISEKWRFMTGIKLVISYHKHKLNPILVHYIYHTIEKGKPCEMDLPLLKNDITTILRYQKPVI
jgi:hypothetical protein